MPRVTKENRSEPDEESRVLAEKLSALTVENIRSAQKRDEPVGPPISIERNARELQVEAPLRDVAYVIEEFTSQWWLANYIDERMPCLRVEGASEEVVPLSINLTATDGSGSHRRWWKYLPFSPRIIREAYSSAGRVYGDDIVLKSTDDVLKSFKKGLEEFLTIRIDVYRKDQQSGVMKIPPRPFGLKGSHLPHSIPSGGLSVEFWCNTSGLTIEFSHAYFLHFLNFGAPSGPVKNTLYAGRYVFRGGGPIYPGGTKNSQIFCIPPDSKAATTHF